MCARTCLHTHPAGFRWSRVPEQVSPTAPLSAPEAAGRSGRGPVADVSFVGGSRREGKKQKSEVTSLPSLAPSSQ